MAAASGQAPRKMKIAHLIAQFYPHLGGAEVCIHNVAGYMASEGHDTTVVCTTLPPAKAPECKYRTIHLPARTCGLLRRIPFLGYAHLSWQMRRLQRKFKFDLWQVTMGYPLGCHAWRTLKAMGVPGVLRCCGEDIQVMPEIDYGYRLDRKCDALIRRSYPNYDSYIAITPTGVCIPAIHSAIRSPSFSASASASAVIIGAAALRPPNTDTSNPASSICRQNASQRLRE